MKSLIAAALMLLVGLWSAIAAAHIMLRKAETTITTHEASLEEDYGTLNIDAIDEVKEGPLVDFFRRRKPVRRMLGLVPRRSTCYCRVCRCRPQPYQPSPPSPPSPEPSPRPYPSPKPLPLPTDDGERDPVMPNDRPEPIPDLLF